MKPIRHPVLSLGKMILITDALLLGIAWVGWVVLDNPGAVTTPLSQAAAMVAKYRAVFIGARWVLWAVIYWQWSRIGWAFAPGESDTDERWRSAWQQRRARFVLPVILVEVLILISGSGASTWA